MTHHFPHIDQQTVVERECIADVWVTSSWCLNDTWIGVAQKQSGNIAQETVIMWDRRSNNYNSFKEFEISTITVIQ